jgi:hypothetical protein
VKDLIRCLPTLLALPPSPGVRISFEVDSILTFLINWWKVAWKEIVHHGWVPRFHLGTKRTTKSRDSGCSRIHPDRLSLARVQTQTICREYGANTKSRSSRGRAIKAITMQPGECRDFTPTLTLTALGQWWINNKLINFAIFISFAERIIRNYWVEPMDLHDLPMVCSFSWRPIGPSIEY